MLLSLLLQACCNDQVQLIPLLVFTEQHHLEHVEDRIENFVKMMLNSAPEKKNDESDE